MEAVSFYLSNIHPEIAKHQKAVFDKLGIPLKQVLTSMTHGAAIDQYIHISGLDSFFIFDIDCIPLNEDAIYEAQLMIRGGNTVYGAAQVANHIPGSEIYCSPAFCCFTREVWEKAGKATFQDTQWHDVGSFFSTEVKRVGGTLELIWPTDVQKPKWDLGASSCFGHGTTYGNSIYHAFESRMNNESTSMFIKKCKEVLNEK